MRTAHHRHGFNLHHVYHPSESVFAAEPTEHARRDSRDERHLPFSITLPARLRRGPPESPGWRAALVRMRPTSRSEWPCPSEATNPCSVEGLVR